MSLRPPFSSTSLPLERRSSPWRGILTGAAVGSALGVLAAFLGEVRAGVPALLALLLVCTVAGAFTWTRCALLWTSGVIAALLAACLLTPVLRAPLAALTLAQAPVRADVIVVLGGGVQCGSAVLEASSMTRLERGLELWRAGYAPVMTVSEQSGLIGPADCPKMSALERAQITALYPQGGPAVLTLANVTTTKDEAARVRAYASARGWKRMLLVTTPSHSRRAAGLFRANGLDVVSVPAREVRFDSTLPLPGDRLWAIRILAYEWLSRLKNALGGTPER
ncbi:YdcF family protein [Deinococcus sp. KSM4-11]|uniref:YdcF family protein n=1 Tax=Deinococcus sp. KSM4-11 TaxID=2568654 RepID=UPI0010A3FC07|nr:YdcF family protein [Deinococcus sp. KSM4-11]THF88939.1 YdcF family protein [Deinococcus sp. KSM4-11]